MEETGVNRLVKIDFPGEINSLFDRAERYSELCRSPKAIEFEFCALFAAWESTALRNSHSRYWFEIWQTRCKKRHRGKEGLTLADPVSLPTLADRWGVSCEETDKAYKSVLEGLRRVFRATSTRLSLRDSDRSSQEAPFILRDLIEQSFGSAKCFACPRGLESFLLTLIQVFERSLGGEKGRLVTLKQWHVELQRKRSVGPAATRTLADVVPEEVRLRRHEEFSDEERSAILKAMLPHMRQIQQELQVWLAKQAA